MLTYLYYAIPRLNYWPKQLKVTEIILISKPGKNPNHVSSYRPISLLSRTISKLLEKLLLPKIVPLLDVIPQHQFGFRHSHSTIQQCHRVVHEINKTLEKKKYCSVFLDISQAFDKVCHDRLRYKIFHPTSNYFSPTYAIASSEQETMAKSRTYSQSDQGCLREASLAQCSI
jgi:hypothetical protein